MDRILAIETRNGVTDNIHYGGALVADARGKIVYCVGDEKKRAFLRSSAKPLQAFRLVMSGGAERFGLTDAEVAIICASHSGGDLQVETVRSVLKKGGLTEDDLKCGSGIRDNCSGKHAGMLLLCRLNGWPTGNYTDRDHPVQDLILETVSRLCDLPRAEIGVGIDGCGAPIFEMPLRNMAIAYARLASGEELDETERKAAKRIVRSMIAHPEMVGGFRWKDLTGDRIVAKGGASGLYCAGAVGRGLGFAMKIADGAGAPIMPVAMKCLAESGMITKVDRDVYLAKWPPVVKNRRGEIVGEIVLMF